MPASVRIQCCMFLLTVGHPFHQMIYKPSLTNAASLLKKPASFRTYNPPEPLLNCREVVDSWLSTHSDPVVSRKVQESHKVRRLDPVDTWRLLAGLHTPGS